jgi:hypothetical protein
MPIDKAALDRYITDVAGDNQELATTLREKLGTNEDAATRFLGGFMRNGDYTKKTQELATQRQQLETLEQDYQQRLTQAETDKNKIMQDLANERISASRAEVLLKTVKEAYGLTDADLPGLSDLKKTEKTGEIHDSTAALDERFRAFEENLMKRISGAVIPEVTGIARLIPIYNGMLDEHQHLFGKKLTETEQNEILQEASQKGVSVKSVWQDRYGVPERRLEVRDEANKSKWRQEWDDDLRKKHQEEALAGVRPGSDESYLRDRQSPIFKRSFAPKEDQQPNDGGNGAQNTPPSGQKTDAQRERLSGAERAAAIFMERSRNGQLGQPLEKKRAS